MGVGSMFKFKFINMFGYVLIVSMFVSMQAQNQPHLTIWVHGTTVRALVPIKNIIPGFHFESELIPFVKLRQKSEAQRRALALYNGDNNQFDTKHFYVFRWSGLLNYDERMDASRDLYKALIKKIKKIKQKTGVVPLINIIAHSHGGNVALSLAQVARQNSEDLIKVDKLILLACPVQDCTASLVYDKMFNKVYNFFSNIDPIQVLAMQKPFKLAGRKFSKYDFKIININTSWQRYGLFHNDFKFCHFVSKLPAALKQIDYKTSHSEWDNKQDYNLVL